MATAQLAAVRPGIGRVRGRSILRAVLQMHRWQVVTLVALPIALSAFMWIVVPHVGGLTLERDGDTAAWARIIQRQFFWGPIANGLLRGYGPVIAGLIAAPFLARRFETGAFRYLWTQSVSRARLLMTEVVVLSGVAAGGALLVAWSYRETFTELAIHTQSGFDGESAWIWLPFSYRPAVFAAMVLVLFGAGIGMGALLRRTVPAIAATGVAWLVFTLFMPTLFHFGLRVQPHELRTYDPLAAEPATQRALREAGMWLPEDVGAGSLEGFPLEAGFLAPGGGLVPFDVYAKDFGIHEDGTGTPVAGARYQKVMEKIGMPFVFRYRAPGDLPLFEAAWATLLSVIGLLFIALAVLRQRPSRR